jgi:hypothetical protein
LFDFVEQCRVDHVNVGGVNVGETGQQSRLLGSSETSQNQQANRSKSNHEQR